MSDEGDVADDATRDGGDAKDGGRTAVVTKAARPQRPTGKRTRARAVEAEEDTDDESVETEAAGKGSSKKGAAKSAGKSGKAKSTQNDKARKPKKAGSVNPFLFVYTYLKQVVAEMRKVIWPNRKQMLTYTSVVLVFLAFMVALVGGADLGLSKLVLLVFG
ncbi:preprotein translocase subunit SecE [Mycobacterium asiaticum]|uniref:Protein translocase subunit SecE n=1 Tax=Mycobacterium asiaticum TaxID=1790 RepID=A0A1A3NQV0_MYCAS|nr:preprotein translocase subunit SecE [Mycobacterium asiaticum]OBK22687.1 preprotein translocase subunit SecE [Mycobacterium asiaticum]